MFVSQDLNRKESAALDGLPLLSQLIYLRVFRPVLSAKALSRINYTDMAQKITVTVGKNKHRPDREELQGAIEFLCMAELVSVLPDSSPWTLSVFCPLSVVLSEEIDEIAGYLL